MFAPAHIEIAGHRIPLTDTDVCSFSVRPTRGNRVPGTDLIMPCRALFMDGDLIVQAPAEAGSLAVSDGVRPATHETMAGGKVVDAYVNVGDHATIRVRPGYYMAYIDSKDRLHRVRTMRVIRAPLKLGTIA